MEEKATSRITTVQFHQAYTYEEFIRGYRARGKDGFVRENGPFIQLAEKAKSDRDSKYVLIIDEINRGNLAKILGEQLLS